MPQALPQQRVERVAAGAVFPGYDTLQHVEVHAISRELPVIPLVVSPCPNLQMVGIDAQAVVAPMANNVLKGQHLAAGHRIDEAVGSRLVAPGCLAGYPTCCCVEIIPITKRVAPHEVVTSAATWRGPPAAHFLYLRLCALALGNKVVGGSNKLVFVEVQII